MQDDFLKNNKDFDAEFVDSAWNDMHALLDVEMPTEKPARRFFFWWFQLGAVGLVLMTYFIWNLSPENDMNIDLNSQFSIANVDQHDKEIVNDNFVSKKQLPKVVMDKNNVVKKMNIMPKIKNDSIIQIENIMVNQENIIFHQPNRSIEKLKFIIEEKEEFKSLIPVSLEVVRPIEIGQRVEKMTISCYAAVDLDESKNKLVSKQVETEEKEIELNSKTVKTKKINPFQFGVQSGISIFNNRILGYSIGTDIAYQFSNKWSVDLGVNYHVLKNNFKRNADSISNLTNDNLESFGANKNPDNQNRQNQVTNMLEIPLKIQFSIHLRWKISSGIQYGISLSKVKAQQISYIGDVDFNFNRHLYTGLKYSKALSKTKLPNFGVALKIGYRF